MLRASFILALIPIGCQEQSVTPVDLPPAATIVAPEDGSFHEPGALIEFVGVVEDDASVEGLTVTFESSVDFVFSGPLTPDRDGRVFYATANLSSGDHAITLSALDPAGNSATDAIQISVDFGGPVVEGAPVVELTGPLDGETYMVAEEIWFVGTATDDEQTNGSLDCTLRSNRDGIFWSGSPDAAGTISVSSTELRPAVHTVTLTCVDIDGLIGTDGISALEIVNDGRPFVTITQPAAGTVYHLGDTIPFEGSVTDDEDANEELLYEWRSSIDGTWADGNPSSLGFVAAPTDQLTAGSHVITLQALDSDNQLASDSLVIDVLDPADLDQDQDGYTPNEGDCDDQNSNLSPGEAELCDGLDNNCDGIVNEAFADVYESTPTGTWTPNDDNTTAYDLGSVDSVLWASSAITLSGLTFHNEDDEDWFVWDAEDDFLIDNVTVDTLLQFPTSGDYTAVLYLAGDSPDDVQDFAGYQQVASTSGNGTLQLQYTGDQWNGDEDYWVLRVYPTSWAPGSCSTNYAIYISS